MSIGGIRVNSLVVKDVDYRLIYMLEQDFEERVRDVYTAKATVHRPPVFLDVLGELIDLEALIFFNMYDEHFKDMDDYERLALREALNAEDPHAIAFVMERMDSRFVEMFARDLYLFLKSNFLFFLERDHYSMDYTHIHNSPLHSIW